MKAKLCIELGDEDSVVSSIEGNRQDNIAAIIVALAENKQLRELFIKAISRSLDFTNEKIKEVPNGTD